MQDKCHTTKSASKLRRPNSINTPVISLSVLPQLRTHTPTLLPTSAIPLQMLRQLLGSPSTRKAMITCHPNHCVLPDDAASLDSVPLSLVVTGVQDLIAVCCFVFLPSTHHMRKHTQQIHSSPSQHAYDNFSFASLYMKQSKRSPESLAHD